MSRIITTALFILIGAGLIVGGLYYYYKRQISYIPEWYSLTTKGAETVVGSQSPDAGKPEKRSTTNREAAGRTDKTEVRTFHPGKIRSAAHANEESADVIKDYPDQPLVQFLTAADPTQTIELHLQQEGRMAISEEALMPLLLQSMAPHGSTKMAEAVKAAKATVQPGKLSMEMIVDVDKIPREELDMVGKKSLAWLQELMQKSGLNQVYLQAELYPVVQGEQMIILPQSSVSVGKIKFSLGDLHQRLGIPLNISMDRFIFSDLKLESGRVVISK